MARSRLTLCPKDYFFAEMKEDMGNPSVMVLDLRPMGHAMGIITNHEVAEQISRASKTFPWSTPKSPTLLELTHLTGTESLLNKEVRRIRDESPVLRRGG
jgi:hypothetical protein